MLKHQIDEAEHQKLSEVERAHYNKTGESYFLDVAGAVPKAQLDEFRANNIELKKQLDAYEGIDPATAKELKAKKDEYETGSATTNAKMNELLEKRTTEMKATYDKELETERTKREEAEKSLAAKTIDGGLVDAGAKHGLRPSASADLISRGRGVFKLEDGKPVAYGPDGAKLYGADGKPLGIDEWLERTSKDAPHLFEPSSGVGAAGSGSGAQHTGPNPWKKDSFNMTQQAQLFKADPDAARRMAAQAGVRL